ncbi:hypothetical protein HanRHA438_Chr14g0660971 [Helianthus annuus]|nr:hypothetical protein HanRHA438_Chr14g0660971 [Helianthus annuus]
MTTCVYTFKHFFCLGVLYLQKRFVLRGMLMFFNWNAGKTRHLPPNWKNVLKGN